MWKVIALCSAVKPCHDWSLVTKLSTNTKRSCKLLKSQNPERQEPCLNSFFLPLVHMFKQLLFFAAGTILACFATKEAKKQDWQLSTSCTTGNNDDMSSSFSRSHPHPCLSLTLFNVYKPQMIFFPPSSPAFSLKNSTTSQKTETSEQLRKLPCKISCTVNATSTLLELSHLQH